MDLVESLGHRLPSEHRHPWEEARLKFIASLIEESVPLANGDIIIDIGCGDGFVAEQLALRYPQCSIFAIDTALTDEFISKVNETLQSTNISFFKDIDQATAACGGRKAALVLLTDVIEHVEDDILFMQSLRSKAFCSPSSQFVITVPAFQALFCTRDISLGHFRRYTNASLRKRLTESGFRISRHGYFFSSLLLGRACRVIWERLFRSNKKQEASMLTLAGNTIISRVMLFMLHADLLLTRTLRRVGINIIGLSNYCICKPQSYV